MLSANPLPSHWPVKELKAWQQQAWSMLKEGRSGLVVLPTGYGKSLLFQLWSYHHPSQITLVLTPLIALIEDHCRRATELGLKARGLHSGMSIEQKNRVLQQLRNKQIQLLFVTPERLRKKDFIDLLLQEPISLLVVDEAHLISQWGHDFRPDYLRIGEFQQQLKPKQTLALTATATTTVQKDIQKHLQLDPHFLVMAPVTRDNLSLNVHPVIHMEEKWSYLQRSLQQIKGPTLIYTSLIQTAYTVFKTLKNQGFPCYLYHGELSYSKKKEQAQSFLASEEGIMVATPAFGMGIDKSNIRQVIHFELPVSLENYYQEVGRAGRDGKMARAELYYLEEDLLIAMEFLQWANPQIDYIKRVFDLLLNHPEWLQQNTVQELRKHVSFHNPRDFRLETTLRKLADYGFLQPARHGIGYQWDPQIDWGSIQYEFNTWLMTQRPDERLKWQQTKLYQFLEFIKNKHECRMQLIAQYFDEKSIIRPCGSCDYCTTH